MDKPVVEVTYAGLKPVKVYNMDAHDANADPMIVGYLCADGTIIHKDQEGVKA